MEDYPYKTIDYKDVRKNKDNLELFLMDKIIKSQETNQ